jgi:cytochrome c oxidase assembly protein subunit 15
MSFRKFGSISLISLYLLILAGAIVRSTGSGMGCPDWPKCFGRYIPPTQVSELPFNYQEIYKEKLHGEVAFNPTKTWIEYINLLLGALTGLFVLITVILSIKEGSRVRNYSMAALILVLGNAVLGKYVVDSFLLPGVVTAHMLLSIGVIFFLIKALNIQSGSVVKPLSARSWVGINLLIIFIQILLGTQVRENMDHVILELGEGAIGQWVSNLDGIYIVHRTFSWLVMASHLILWSKLKISSYQTYRYGMVGLIGISFLTGILMAYFALPLGSQAVHLVVSLVLVGWHIHTWIETKKS